MVAIDLDGTLLDSHKRLDPDFPELLHELLEREVVVVPASGRQHESITRILGLREAAVQQRSPNLDVIAENGALVSRGGEVVAIEALDPEVVTQVLARVEGFIAAMGDGGAHGDQVGIVVCGRESAYVTRGDDTFLAVTAPYYPLLREVASWAEIEDDVLKVAIWDARGVESGVRRAIGEVPGGRVLTSAHVWVDIMNPDADKGHALAELQRLHGIGPERTMAFGDFPNDVGMLRRAHYSYAMRDAHPQARAAARFTAGSNDEQAVTRVLRRMLAS